MVSFRAAYEFEYCELLLISVYMSELLFAPMWYARM